MTDNLTDIWLPVSEVQKLLGINERSIQRHCSSGKYTTKITTNNRGRDGKKLYILLSSLPLEAQASYMKQFLPEKVEKIDDTILLYTDTADYNRRKANKYNYILLMSAGLKGDELKEWIKEYNKTCEEGFKTSYARVISARKRQKELGRNSLIANYGKNAGWTKVLPDWLDYYRQVYMIEGAPSSKTAHLATFGYVVKKGYNIKWDEFPSYTTFQRQLNKIIPLGSQYYARFGREAWYRKFACYINRNNEDLRACEVWYSDHHQFDVFVIDRDGTPRLPWITAWRDMRSGKWLSWSIHCESPNSDYIFQAFYYGALEYGLPDYIYIDNGKDYRCRDFAGGKKKADIDINKTSNLVLSLGVTPLFAEVYNGQTKQIERDFRLNKDILAKVFPGYRGGNVKERPERLKKELEQNKILTINEFELLFDDFILNVYNKKPQEYSKHLDGISPDQMWERTFTFKKDVSKEALKLFCMRSSKTKTIRRNGIEDSEIGKKIHYYAEWMSQYTNSGIQFYIRRDPKKYQEAWVFRADNDEFVGTAIANEFDVPGIAKTDIDREKLKKALKLKKGYEKRVRELAKVPVLNPVEYIDNLKTAISSTTNVETKSMPKVIDITPTKMDKVLEQKEKMENEHKVDLSGLVPRVKKEIPFFLSETDKEVYYKKNAK